MTPMDYELLLQIVHQERIQAEEAGRRERMYAPPPSACARQESSASRLLRRTIAQSLYRVAGRLGRTKISLASLARVTQHPRTDRSGTNSERLSGLNVAAINPSEEATHGLSYS